MSVLIQTVDGGNHDCTRALKFHSSFFHFRPVTPSDVIDPIYGFKESSGLGHGIETKFSELHVKYQLFGELYISVFFTKAITL